MCFLLGPSEASAVLSFIRYREGFSPSPLAMEEKFAVSFFFLHQAG